MKNNPKKSKILSYLIIIFCFFLLAPVITLANDTAPERRGDFSEGWDRTKAGAAETWGSDSDLGLWDSKFGEDQSLWDVLSPNIYLLSTDKVGPYEPYVDKHPAVIIARLISTIFNFLAAIFIALIVYAGFAWMLARGEQEKITTARNIMKNSVIGLAIILGAHVISYFIFQSLTATIY